MDRQNSNRGCSSYQQFSGGEWIDRRLVEAAITGDAKSMDERLALHNPSVLLGTTPLGSTCLHISSIHGHKEFSEKVLALNSSLLAAVNSDGETPLLTAVRSGHASLASSLLRYCSELGLNEAILKQDKCGSNALHHSIRCGNTRLALDLIQEQPHLSRDVNKYNETPMFIAVMKNYEDVSGKLLEFSYAADTGAGGYNALHAAVRNGNSVMAKMIMESRPHLARAENRKGSTPVRLAVLWDKIHVLRVLLEHDVSLGYLVSTQGAPLLVSAAYRGHVGVAQELFNGCPDAPYCDTNGWTCLHEAVCHGQTNFVEFVVGSHNLRKLIHMRDNDGKTALHHAVQKCNPKMVAALVFHKDIDVTILDNSGEPATWELSGAADHAKTLNWNEVCMLMLKADPNNTRSIYNLHKGVKENVTDASRNNVKSLTQTYTGNTSLVAILIATITFAAAFTLPGGYGTDAGNEGLPIMARKFAFQVFLISDTLAMWEDFEFLLYYRTFTKKLMWFAYMATTTAFSTGLYTVLAPRLPWLAIAICVVSVLLPVFTKLLGEWPALSLRFRLGLTFKSDLLNMV